MARLQKQSLVAAAVALAIGTSGLVHGAEDALQEVTVTGSRITQSSGMNAPTPVTAVAAAELSQMSPGNIVDALSQLPQFFGNIGSEQIVGGQNSGGANVNLRGAGVNRTLVLLDGRRVVSSNRFGTVDVNMFPESLLRGIETVTGGASASYGTDAVAGVVNFLLDTDFEGVKLHGQGGETTRGDGGNWEASIAGGHAFGEKLHVIGSLMATEQDPIKSFRSLEKRRYFNQTSRVTNPDPTGPLEVILPYVTPTNFSNQGLIIEPTFPTLNRQEFQSDGTIRPMARTTVGNLNTGCQCFADNSQTYGVDSDTEVASGYKRTNGFVHVKYDLTDNTNVYFQGLMGTTRTDDRRESISLLSVWQARIYADNPYLAADTRQKMLAVLPANRQYVGFGFFGLDSPDTPLGDTRQITDNRMKSGTLGMKTDFKSGFLDGWHMSAYYQYGENRQDFNTRNGIRTDRLPLALDVVADASGKPVCRVSLPQFDPKGIFAGCVPVNLFGGLDNLSPQAVDWIRDDNKTARQWTDQHNAEIVLDGTLWEEAFGAGPLAGAFGVSYRKDSLDQKTLAAGDEFPALPDGTLLSDLGVAPASLRGVVPQGESGGIAGYNGIPGLRFVPTGFKGDGNSSSVQFSSLRAISGGYSVKEAFTELNIPVLKRSAGREGADLQHGGPLGVLLGKRLDLGLEAGRKLGHQRLAPHPCHAITRRARRDFAGALRPDARWRERAGSGEQQRDGDDGVVLGRQSERGAGGGGHHHRGLRVPAVVPRWLRDVGRLVRHRHLRRDRSAHLTGRGVRVFPGRSAALPVRAAS